VLLSRVESYQEYGLYQDSFPEILGSSRKIRQTYVGNSILINKQLDRSCATNRNEIHSAAILRQGRVTPRSSSYKRFMQILAKQNCIGVDTRTILTKEVKDPLGSGHMGLGIHVS
jgi:hypothetical protein